MIGKRVSLYVHFFNLDIVGKLKLLLRSSSTGGERMKASSIEGETS